MAARHRSCSQDLPSANCHFDPVGVQTKIDRCELSAVASTYTSSHTVDVRKRPIMYRPAQNVGFNYYYSSYYIIIIYYCSVVVKCYCLFVCLFIYTDYSYILTAWSL